MTDTPRSASPGWLGTLLASASFARAFTLVVFGAVFSAFAIERVAGRVTYVTIVSGLCVLGIGVMAARRRELSLLRLVPTTVVIFVGWAFVSIFWSSDVGTSFWSWVSMATMAFLAVVIGHVRDTLQTVRALGDVLRALLAVSLALEVLSGILLDVPFAFLGIQGDLAQLGPIQGIFGTRNLLGFVAVLALITFLIEYRTQSVRPGLSVASVVLAGGLAVLSDSPTVVVLALGVGLAVGALALVRHARPERRAGLQLALGALVVIGVFVGYAARHPIIALLGAGTDFSMRVELWNFMVDILRQRPVQGFGWFGVWNQGEYPFNAINFWLDTDHATGLNAYFDVALQLGWVGLVLFLAIGALALGRSWLVAGERRSVVYAWTPLMLVALLVNSMFESFTLTGLGWLMLVLCAVRAGQSRSWREKIDNGTDADGPGSGSGSGLPHAQGEQGMAG
ncbi:O-antigen ligase family protein [Microbacterium sp. M3]|uniref:O-antigen ligase family protein n=1 Tax=Microbacterium arthrosphaerae TaxID=792652 RepID=A0ABU4H201_9MICO|nr:MULTISPECIES: O-antigen ligase family protein [Microbacterium]MDW4573357.1 O-antigen ligase family protein [Microbacterium arthrosphaerae]MDW7607212.1 O-antigen ligase family protein [Microbacterium sp. M3]